MPEGCKRGTVNERRKSFTVEARDPAHGKKSHLTVKASMAQAVSASLAWLQGEHYGKSLATYFDGRDGKEVAESTLSRWISEPSRFPAVFVPVLAELDPEFRSYLLRSLFVGDLVAAVVTTETPPEAADAIRREMESRFLDQVYGHNRMGEHYA